MTAAMRAADLIDSRPHRMLIVDDDPDLRALLSLQLNILDDFEVVGEAGNGLEAIRLVGLLKPAGVVLDNEMPVMRGHMAIPLMRQIAPELQIVMYSGTGARDNQLLSEIANHYIEKGGSMHDFVRQLRAAMARPAAIPA